MEFLDIKNIAFQIWNYPISYVELIGTLFGLVSVYFATRASILTWPTGIINEIFLFALFFQVHLYADMFLQIYFLIVTLYGWYTWKQRLVQKSYYKTSVRTRITLSVIIVLSTIIIGFLIMNIHNYLPQYFKLPAAFPFIDSFIMVCSIVATALLAKKRIESWYLWIMVDVVCVMLYFKKEI